MSDCLPILTWEESIEEKGAMQCTICRRRFLDIESLSIHSKTHPETKVLQCYVCNDSFSNTEDVLSHLSVHNIPQPFQCGLCQDGFYDKKMLVEHLLASHEPFLFPLLYRCQLCRLSYHVMSDFKKHMQENHLDRLNKYQCSHCTEKFESTTALQRHVHTCLLKIQGCISSGPQDIKFEDEGMSADYIMSVNDDNIESVQSSGYLIPPKNNVKRKHKALNTPFESITSSTELSTEDSGPQKEDSVSVENSMQICIECDAKFTSQDILVLHQHYRHGKQVYQIDCVKCCQSFESIELLNKHYKETECEGFKCDFCQETFEMELTCLIHVAISHFDKREDFTCHHCENIIRSAKGYIQHLLKTHASSKPFVCRLCLEKYSIFESLLSHIKLFHNLKVDVASKSLENAMRTGGGLVDESLILSSNCQMRSKDCLGKISCNDCGKSFDSPDELVSHQRLNKMDNFYTVDCDKCKTSFSSLRLLSLHLKSDGCEKYSCSICFDDFDLEYHYLKHLAQHEVDAANENTGIDNLSITCKKCGEDFSFGLAYTRHVQIHSRNKPFKCTICFQHFSNVKKLCEHFEGKHRKNEGCKNVSGEQIDLDDGDFNQYSAFCRGCTGCFSNEKRLKEHIQTSSCQSYDCGLCNNLFYTQSDLILHEMNEHLSNNNDELKCCKCCEKISTKSDYMHHAQNHADFKSLKCNLCVDSFVSSDAFMLHVARVHPEDVTTHQKNRETEILCRICNKTFTNLKARGCHVTKKHKVVCCFKCSDNFKTKTDLRAHMKKTHQEISACQYCGKKMNSNNIQRHEGLHTRDNPYQCQFCAKIFWDKSHLGVHLKSHSSEKPYKCKLCDYSCKRSSLLKEHIDIHHAWGSLDHICPTCGKGFKTKCYLWKHQKMHGKKSIVCNVCGAGFAKSAYLNVHTRIHHTFEKPYICPVCSKTFAVQSNKNTHLKKIHPDYVPQKKIPSSSLVCGSDLSH